MYEELKQELQNVGSRLGEAFSPTNRESAELLAVYLAVGGLLALYLRFLYARCGVSTADSSAFTRIFPLLTLVTTAVIAVVKSSMALSLGLVGALSIVRFRAAIKEPEELVYLFLCIAVGLSLGAQMPLIAVALVLVATVFVLGIHYLGHGVSQQQMMLTITGDADRYFRDPQNGVVSAVTSATGRCVIHRLDVENGRGQVRILLGRSRSQDIHRLISDLQTKLPGCEFSFVDMRSLL